MPLIEILIVLCVCSYIFEREIAAVVDWCCNFLYLQTFVPAIRVRMVAPAPELAPPLALPATAAAVATATAG